MTTATRPLTESAVLDALARELEQELALTRDDVLAARRAFNDAPAKAPQLSAEDRAKASGRIVMKLGEHFGEDGIQILDQIANRPLPSIIETQRVLLGELVREGIPPIEYLHSPTLGEGLFYAGMVSILAGHKKSGKSLAMFSVALDRVAAEEPSVYLDLENGQNAFARRMALFAADPDAVDEHFHDVPFPQGLTLENIRAELEGIAKRTPGALVIVDSLRGAIARLSPPSDPLKVNDPQSIERVCQPFMEAAKTLGLTVCIIDHPTKIGNDVAEYSTANSAAKEAAVDAVYFWTKVQPFSADVAGAVTLKVTSDREGQLNLGEKFKRAWRVGGQGTDKPINFAAVDPAELEGADGRILEDVRQYAADNEKEPITLTKFRSAVTGDSSARSTGRSHSLQRLSSTSMLFPERKRAPSVMNGIATGDHRSKD
jgi:KaiC/GvpD/RAD55 family RecA-like ATPase